MAKTKVEVTATDIKRALAFKKKTGFSSSRNCPVALAIQRAAKKGTVSVCQGSAILEGKIISLPEKVNAFICRFDFGQPVKPFSFTLSV